MASRGTNPNPITAAVIASIAVFVFLFTAGAAVAGSYLVALDVAHKQTVAAQKAASAEAVAQIRNSIPTCRALVAMDNARLGITFPKIDAAHPSELYITRSAAAIHSVVVASRCTTLLDDVAHHEPYAEIAHQLGG